MRVVVLLLALAPFAFYAFKDTVAHLKLRKPGWRENVIHLVLAIQQGALIIGAFRGSVPRMLVAGVGVTIAGVIDEWGFHRDLPNEESNLHAKGHFALFGFAMLSLAVATFPTFGAALDAALGNSP